MSTKKKRIVISLTPTQHDLLLSLMESRRQDNISAFIVAILDETERLSQKRSVGRPKSSSKQDEDEDDGVARYQSPDYPKTKSRYTKAEVDSWYDFRGLSVPEGAYKAHPDVSA